jgi:nitroreductase
MKQLLKALASLLPPGVRHALRGTVRALRARYKLRRALRYDADRFARHSGMTGLHTPASHAAAIIKTYHRIEKGLSLPEPRPGFGAQAARQLIEELSGYIDVCGPDEVTRAALNAMNEYLVFNRGCGVTVDSAITDGVSRLQFLQGNIAIAYGLGGIRPVTREGIHAAAAMDLEAFFASRYSVRQFSDQQVDMALIEKAAAMAQKTPSVCNREAGRVAVISDKTFMNRAFSHQNGNRGFGDRADKLLIVAADQACFLNVGERYQAWIDGGMYAMSLVYALHSLGLGTCCLNWSVEPQADRALHADLGLPQQWAVIMMIAVGHMPECFSVAQSPRRPLSEVLRVLGDGQTPLS